MYGPGGGLFVHLHQPQDCGIFLVELVGNNTVSSISHPLTYSEVAGVL